MYHYSISYQKKESAVCSCNGLFKLESYVHLLRLNKFNIFEESGNKEERYAGGDLHLNLNRMAFNAAVYDSV